MQQQDNMKPDIIAIDQSIFLDRKHCIEFINNVIPEYKHVIVYSFKLCDDVSGFTRPVTIQYDFHD